MHSVTPTLHGPPYYITLVSKN